MKRKIKQKQNDPKRNKIDNKTQNDGNDILNDLVINKHISDDIIKILRESEIKTLSEDFSKLTVNQENEEDDIEQDISELTKKNEEMDIVDHFEDMETYQNEFNNYVKNLSKYKSEWKKSISINDKITLKSEGIIFQETKTEYTIRNTMEFNFLYPGPKDTKVPVIRMFGVTEKRETVLCNIWGFRPYLYVEIPNFIKINNDFINEFNREIEDEFLKDKIQKVEDKFDIELCECNNEWEVSQIKKKRERRLWALNKYVKCIDEINYVEKYSIWTYQFNKKKRLLKIYTYIPSNVYSIRKIVERGIKINGVGNNIKFQTYESNVLFILRCLIDSDIYPTTWIEAKQFEYSRTKESSCDIEIDVSCNNII